MSTRMMNAKAGFFIVVPPVAIAALVVAYAQHPWNFLRVLGLVLLVPALILLTIARFNLGSSFSVTPQARQLVTTGVYSRIRNPIYVFSTIGLAGLFLYLHRPVLLLLLLPLIAVQVWRARAESRVLEERFGEEYRRYKARTWF